MNILICCETFGIGGVETHVYTLAKQLKKFEHEVTIVTKVAGLLAKEIKKESIKVYETKDINKVKARLQQDAEMIQCVVSNGIIENSVYFGNTQKPNLWDYADNVDTLDFLNNL